MLGGLHIPVYPPLIIVTKFTEICATRWLLWHSDFTKFNFGWGLCPGTRWWSSRCSPRISWEGGYNLPSTYPPQRLGIEARCLRHWQALHFQMLPPAIAALSNHCYNANLLKLLTLQYSIRCYHHSRGIKALTCILINSHKNWCHAQELKLPLVSIIAQL